MSQYRKVSDRRVKRVIMTREVLNPIFRGDVGIVCGLPEDAQFVRTFDVPERATQEFVFKSKEFDAVEEGAKIPTKQIGAIQLDADVRNDPSFHHNWDHL